MSEHDDTGQRLAAAPAPSSRAWRWLRWPLLALAALLVLVAGFASWVLWTAGGTAWAVGHVATRVDGLRIESAGGTLGRGLVVRGLHFAPPRGGTQVDVRHARVVVALAALLRGTVHVRDARVDGVRVRLDPAPDDEEDTPLTLDPPIDVVVDRLVATDAIVRGAAPKAADRAGAASVDADRRDAASPARPVLATVHRAELRGRWTSDALELERFDLRAREGAIRLQARVVAAGPGVAATADGTFRWRIGALEPAGTLAVRTAGERTRADLRLTAPVVGHLAADVRQVADHPWSARLRVPAFDPREAVLPDGALASLAATFDGEGTARAATLVGRVDVDGENVHVETLRVRREADAVVLDPLLVRLGDAPGRLRVTGRASLDAGPLRGRMVAWWDELAIPERFAGQPLRTRGRIAAAGSAATWRAEGALGVGPPGRLAQLEFVLDGAPERVRLERLDVAQATGRLAASGVIDLRPRVGWRLDARATSFDPGELLAGWSGDLRFALRTEGEIVDAGPRGRLALERLRGSLRGRPLSGDGELEFAAPGRLAGTLALRSGESRLDVVAAPSSTLDATARFRVASLDDFVPGAQGTVRGSVRARGEWPEVTVTGDAAGAGLRVAAAAVDDVDLSFTVRNPTAPDGRVRLSANGVSAGGLAFASVSLTAAGDRARHAARFVATGEPLGLEARVSGAFAEATWRGSVERLGVQLGDAADLQLEAPVRVAAGAGAFEVARACLVDGDVRLCGRGRGAAGGVLEASYELAGVPLALASVLAADALPGTLSGALGGSGTLRRNAAGLWFGDASLESATAAIEWTDDAPAEALGGRELTLYRDLRASVQLRGTSAEARVSAAPGGDGSLTGAATLTELDAATPAVRATLAARLPTLAPFAPLVPQLDALDGEVSADATVAGTLARPEIRADVRAERLRAEVPVLGLRLHDGRVRLAAQPGGDMQLDGEVRSGEGALTIRGTVGAGGAVAATVAGENFLAADLPAARVLAAPDLRFERAAERMRLTGTITIPAAVVNVQRLPQAGPQAKQRSPDVVVVNEPPPAADTVAAVPLQANVEVILGDDIELTGFGLDATLTGGLTVRETPGRPTTGSGEIRIAGTYQAYGQDLTITDGRVLYAGTALDDPRLDITAVREVDTITAGLRITGRARSPDVRVFSDPSLGQTDALAYLVAGRPLSAVGRGGDAGEGDMLQQASERLGSAAGGLLAKRLGRRLGVDEVGVTDSEEIGGAAFTVGQYLSPRLYLGYGVGLFDPGQIVTIRYSLSEALSIEAVRGDETTRAGVEYRVER